MRTRRIAGLMVVATVVPGLAGAAPVLDRDPARYLVLGMQRARLKNLAVAAPGCHVGVSCPMPLGRRSACGVLRGKRMDVAAPGALVGETVCTSGDLFAVFRNGGRCAPDCGAIVAPGTSPDCTEPFVAPVLGDLDGDGQPSCGDGCRLDIDDVALACGVTLPLPPCDPVRPVEVARDADCLWGDRLPGNFQCDLPAGTYGAIHVRDGAKLVVDAGTTIACGIAGGRAVTVKSAGVATLLLPGTRGVRLNNNAEVGSACGQLRIVTDRGAIRLGRYGDFTLDACTVAGRMGLGHANTLRGHFVGREVTMDLNNTGRCCDGSGPPSTTTTTTSSSTSTSVGPGGPTTTTTTSTGGTSTTTTLATGGFTRTIGFWKNRPDLVAAVLGAAGGIRVCGRAMTTVDVDAPASAIEALCVAPRGDERLQLVRQLTAAALNAAAGGAVFGSTVACDAVCADAGATAPALTACVDLADAFNNAGDALPAPWGPPGAADPEPCAYATETDCTVLEPVRCSAG